MNQNKNSDDSLPNARQIIQSSKGSFEETNAVRKKSSIALTSLIVALFGVSLIFVGIILIFISFVAPISWKSVIDECVYWVIGPTVLLSFAAAFCLSTAAFFQIGFSGRQLGGLTCSVAAFVLSLIFCFIVLTSNFVVSNMNRKRDNVEAAWEGEEQIRQLGTAIVEYARDHDGFLPVAEQWCDLLVAQNDNISADSFKHPAHTGTVCNFAFNKTIGGLKLEDVPGNVVLLFEADGSWNLTGGQELLETKKYKKKGVALVLFVDKNVGHYIVGLEMIMRCQSDQYFYNPVRWEPY